MKKKGPSKVLLIVFALALLVSAVLMYFILFSQPDVTLETQGAVSQAGLIKTDFKTEIFEDKRLQGLKQYGPAEVQVTQRGAKTDPFQAF